MPYLVTLPIVCTELHGVPREVVGRLSPIGQREIVVRRHRSALPDEASRVA
jgi:hypothetical protein